MVRGFYQIGSGIFAQQKKLNTIANNLANTKTTGYKKQTVVTESFHDMMINRIQAMNGETTITPIGNKSMTRVTSQVATLHSQGTLQPTDRDLDVAIIGEGFFTVQTPQGTAYTRKGSFNIDDEGYLTLAGGGRVMGKNGLIRPNTDNVTFGDNGNVYANNQLVGTLQVVNFQDYNQLQPLDNGFYTANGAGQQVNATIRGKTLEGSNVDSAEEITNAIAAQRELQTQSQVLKMYDTTLQKATNEISKIN